MICNVSRLTTFQECRQKDSYLHEHHLIPNRTPTPLLTGGAIHTGLEHFFKSGSVDVAVVELERNYRERIGEQTFVLPEESEIYEKELTFSKKAVVAWATHYEEMGFTVLYPEVTFCVPLPGTEHHCFWMHKLLHPGTADSNINVLAPDGCGDPRCVVAHHLKGKADGVVNKQGKIWLLETKSSAMTGTPFFDRWFLALQPTAYMWGVWKATGVKPHGFIMNVIKKPNHNFKGNLDDWFARDPFEREAYVRSDEDFDRFEREAKKMFDERERAHRDGIIYMNSGSCVMYNRRCHFFDRCQRNGEEMLGEFRIRPTDYVEEEYYKLAGLEVPKPTLPQIASFEAESEVII
jgi:hypothetical protein